MHNANSEGTTPTIKIYEIVRKCKDLPVGLPRYLGNAGREPELATCIEACFYPVFVTW